MNPNLHATLMLRGAHKLRSQMWISSWFVSSPRTALKRAMVRFDIHTHRPKKSNDAIWHPFRFVARQRSLQCMQRQQAAKKQRSISIDCTSPRQLGINCTPKTYWVGNCFTRNQIRDKTHINPRNHLHPQWDMCQDNQPKQRRTNHEQHPTLIQETICTRDGAEAQFRIPRWELNGKNATFGHLFARSAVKMNKCGANLFQNRNDEPQALPNRNGHWTEPNNWKSHVGLPNNHKENHDQTFPRAQPYKLMTTMVTTSFFHGSRQRLTNSAFYFFKLVVHVLIINVKNFHKW